MYLRGKKASKSQLHQHAAGKSYFHLSTHGFFAPIPQRKTSEQKKDDATRSPNTRKAIQFFYLEEEKRNPLNIAEGVNPMLYSGIVLAGANKQESENDTKDDGIITAEELAGLNLNGTKLLVLSACETALGETVRGQGISGLRMASQAAGVNTMLISLWKVEDEGTQKFMQAFYERLWKEKQGSLQALQSTKKEWIEKQRKNTPGTGSIYSPKVWAAFILSGER